MAEVRTLRIPDELWAWLQADAQRYGRTVAQSVRFYLTRAMEAGPQSLLDKPAAWHYQDGER